jgi:hypothetical protein
MKSAPNTSPRPLSRRLRPLVLVIGLALVASAGSALASAAPRAICRDRADNGYSLSYDASEGRIVQALSSVMLKNGDPVRFLTSVTEAKGGMVGVIKLTLQSQKRFVYNGRFKLSFKDGTQTVVSSSKTRRVVLTRDSRKATVRFPLTLPSGDFEVLGSFNSH